MCPHRLVLEHVTSRWGVLVLIQLLERPYRFSELRRAIGRVSEKMLTQTLQTLERDGLVHRDAKPVIPPRVDYSSPSWAARRPSGSAAWPCGPSSVCPTYSPPGRRTTGPGRRTTRPGRRGSVPGPRTTCGGAQPTTVQVSPPASRAARSPLPCRSTAVSSWSAISVS